MEVLENLGLQNKNDFPHIYKTIYKCMCTVQWKIFIQARPHALFQKPCPLHPPHEEPRRDPLFKKKEKATFHPRKMKTKNPAKSRVFPMARANMLKPAIQHWSLLKLILILSVKTTCFLSFKDLLIIILYSFQGGTYRDLSDGNRSSRV